jgi:methionyl-tRNA formyltransferase
MRIVFLGSGAFGLPTLQHLAARHTVVGVVTQPDKPAGRGSKLTPTPIGAWAAEHLPGTPLIKPEKINTPEVRDLVRSWECDAWVVIAFGQKLGPTLLADRFAINLHASLLPRWRGAAPINHAILAGDTVTGNSVITLADRMDAGLVLGQSRRPIEPAQTTGELHDLLATDGPALVEQVLAEHAASRSEVDGRDVDDRGVGGQPDDGRRRRGRSAHLPGGLLPVLGQPRGLAGDRPGRHPALL